VVEHERQEMVRTKRKWATGKGGGGQVRKRRHIDRETDEKTRKGSKVDWRECGVEDEGAERRDEQDREGERTGNIDRGVADGREEGPRAAMMVVRAGPGGVDRVVRGDCPAILLRAILPVRMEWRLR
jgi:hypothetical protein